MEAELVADEGELGADETSDGIRGGGGGRGNGESSVGVEVLGVEGTTTLAFFFNSRMCSLYASFSSLTFFSPSLEGMSVSLRQGC